jgi:hypothetical protein
MSAKAIQDASIEIALTGSRCPSLVEMVKDILNPYKLLEVLPQSQRSPVAEYIGGLQFDLCHTNENANEKYTHS